MIRFFFSRFSKVVTLMEVIGILLLAASAVRLFFGNTTIARVILLMAVAGLYAFIRFCASVRWYKGLPRHFGIELQFYKSIVPTSYIMAISLGWFVLTPSAVPLGITIFLLAVIAHVNVILLYFHYRDRDITPANYYSSGRFLHDAET